MGARRGQGEGSIYQRESDGLWCTAVHLGYLDGKRRRKVIYGKTRREVAEKLKVVLREQQQGLPVALERQTVAQFLHRWLEDVVGPSVRPRTSESYAQLVRLHLVPTLGRHQLNKLEPQHVQAMMNRKLESGLSPRTVQYIRAVLRRALGQALKWGLVARNVATLVDPPRSRRQPIRPLTPVQGRMLLEAARGDRLEALYRVALSLGLRIGEALGLRWDDVDLERGVLRISSALQRVGGKLQLVEPKSTQSRRTLALPVALIAALKIHRVRQLQERLASGDRWQDSGHIFTTTIGTPLEPRNATRAFKAMLVAAGLPDIRFHDLRHSCASLLVAQGIHPRVVMETLGHSQISLTMNTYAHVFADAQREAAATMDCLFPAATSDIG
ncbi:MAG: site-specific integrase [Chloroflexota bacterium]|nr:site-specific integrase [Chloroflexota bacterium]